MRALEMTEHNGKGVLITLCGLDGCGKTTLIERLAELVRERGYEVLLTKQPTSAVRESEIFRRFHDTPEHNGYSYRALSLLAAADRIQHSRFVIGEALARGCVVISDRYFYSCLANLRARGYGGDAWIYEISREIPRPDIAFFLNLPTELAISRVRARPSERNSYIDAELEERLRSEYLTICRENGGVLIDTSGDVEAAFSEIKRNLKSILK